MTTFGSIFDVEGKKSKFDKIEREISHPEFWSRSKGSRQILQQRSRLEHSLGIVFRFRELLEDLEVLIELYSEGEDAAEDIRKQLSELEKQLSKTEFQALFSQPHDQNNGIVTIHPGAGGTESQDWAEMLLRMYIRWAERRGYGIEIVDYQAGEEAGLRSVTFVVEGEFVYGYLSAETGVHRLVRISPFDAGSRRHTSFASVFVTPEIDENIDIQIDEKDLRIDTYRSSGAGGQHVNVTDSAVRITHLPTEIVVQCQNERSQHRNKNTAMKILRSRLYEWEIDKKRKELDKVEASKANIAWGSQIRSYVLQPYQMVKDHRTKLEIGNVDSVLDGDIDAFMIAYLKQNSGKKLRQKKEAS